MPVAYQLTDLTGDGMQLTGRHAEFGELHGCQYSYHSCSGSDKLL